RSFDCMAARSSSWYHLPIPSCSCTFLLDARPGMRGEAMSSIMRLFSMDSPRLRGLLTGLSVCVGIAATALPCPAQAFDSARGILIRGTVVTMDSAGTIFKGGVLIRSGLIVAVWKGPKPPNTTPVKDAVTIDLGQDALIFPGLINLHDHPTFDI